MSRASKEEIAAENALYERLILALTESLTALSSEDLQKWGSRSGLFTNLDATGMSHPLLNTGTFS